MTENALEDRRATALRAEGLCALGGTKAEVKTVPNKRKPWLSVYGGRLSEEPIGGSLSGFLEDVAEKYRDNIALTRGERRACYGELLGLTRKMASAFTQAGVRKGDRVALMLPNCPEYVVAFFGVMRRRGLRRRARPSGRRLAGGGKI